MTPWFVDASVLLAAEDVDDANHQEASRFLAGTEPVATLDLAWYEVTNVAVRVWRNVSAAHRLRERVAALADDGGVAQADSALLATAVLVAEEHDISVYDAAYVAAARALNGRLVSCDVRGLVSRGLARLPGDALPP